MKNYMLKSVNAIIMRVKVIYRKEKNIMKKYLLFFFILIISMSCSNKIMKVTPDYQSKFIDAENLFVCFVPEQPIIEISDNLISSLGTGSKNEIYLSYFGKSFQKFVKQNSTFKQVMVSSKNYQFNEKEFFVNSKEKMLFKIPLFSKNDIKTDDTGYTLFLEDIKIHHKKGDDDSIMPSNYGVFFIGGDDPLIIQQGKFLIWDNSLNKVVSYGKIEIKTKVKRKQVEETWANVNSTLSEYLFSSGPFQKRK